MKKYLLPLSVLVYIASVFLTGTKKGMCQSNLGLYTTLSPDKNSSAFTGSINDGHYNRSDRPGLYLFSAADLSQSESSDQKPHQGEPGDDEPQRESEDYSQGETVFDDSEPDEEPDAGKDADEGLDETKFIMSRFTGTFVGFGTGHALQGRWLSHGWIFTLGDLLTWPVITLVWPLYGRGKNYRAGAALWFLIHGIEVWDLWSYTGDDPDLIIKPVSLFNDDKNHYGLSLSWNF